MVRMFMGVLMLLLCGYSVYVMINNGAVGGMQLVLLPVFFIAGLLYIMIGLGKNPISLLGDAYVEMDETSIKLKPSVKASEWTINWSEVNEVRIKITAIVFNNDVTHQISFDKLSKSSEDELKSYVITIAKEKNIKLT